MGVSFAKLPQILGSGFHLSPLRCELLALGGQPLAVPTFQANQFLNQWTEFSMDLVAFGRRQFAKRRDDKLLQLMFTGLELLDLRPAPVANGVALGRGQRAPLFAIPLERGANPRWIRTRHESLPVVMSVAEASPSRRPATR